MKQLFLLLLLLSGIRAVAPAQNLNSSASASLPVDSNRFDIVAKNVHQAFLFTYPQDTVTLPNLSLACISYWKMKHKRQYINKKFKFNND